MPNLTGPRDDGQRNGVIVPLALAVVKVYKGGAAAVVLGTGNGTPLIPTTITHVFVGVFGETYDNTGGTAGGYFTKIIRKGVIRFAQTGITAASIREPAFFSDDHTVTTTPGTTYAGIIVAVDAAGFAWVEIDDAVQHSQNAGRNWIALAGSTDAVNPHIEANYIVNTAGVDAMTLAAPTAGVDDGTEITLSSGGAHAHTLTATGLLNTGAAAVNVATFAAHTGAMVKLKAYNGAWQVMSQVGITFS